MDVPRTIDDVQRFVDNHIQESVHLDYKRSDALSEKGLTSISKDVSAFANSDGGLLIYGVEESGHLPVRVDAGVDDGCVNRERIEHIADSNIAPRIDGLEVIAIPVGEERSIYVVSIPRSRRAPHQDRQTSRYYKRYNFKSEPMEDYEIRDIRSRVYQTPALVRVQVQIRHGLLLYLVVSNPTDIQVRDVRITLEKNATKVEEDVFQAPAIRDGIPVMHPGMELVYFYGRYTTEDAGRQEVVAHVRYLHPLLNAYYEDHFTFDLDAYRGSAVDESEFYERTRDLSRHLEAIKNELHKVADAQKELVSVVEDGLRLSPTSLLDLHQVLSGQQAPKVSPYGRSYDFFRRILGVSAKVAYGIMKCFDDTNGDMNKMASIEGITESDLRRIGAVFDLEPLRDQAKE